MIDRCLQQRSVPIQWALRYSLIPPAKFSFAFSFPRSLAAFSFQRSNDKVPQTGH
jgi:hypothetical protein